MNQVSTEVVSYSREDTLHKNTPDLTTTDVIILGEDAVQTRKIETHHGVTEDQEYQVLLGRQAANLALAIGVSNDHDIKVREVKRFIGNAGSSEAFIDRIIDKLEGKTKTETAAALKAQNEALRLQFEAMKEALKGRLSKEDLLAIAPFLKLPNSVDIDVEEFASEVQDALVTTQEQELIMPSTAELEASVENVTDDTVSPARGIALLGHWTVDILKKSRDYIMLPPPAHESPEYETQLQNIR